MVEESGFQVGRDAPLFYEAHVARFMAPFVAALVAGAVRPRDAVLDVACGTGFAARAAAAIAGAGARVDGVDLNAAMIAVARTVPDDSGAAMTWSEASALDLPFPEDVFDAVICQQGLQFFPDQVAALREMARVARPGGRIAVTVWCPAPESPFLDHEAAMLARFARGPQAGFSTTEALLSAWFEDAGIQASIERLTVDVDLPAVLDYVPQHLRALPWSAGFLALPTEVQVAGLTQLEAELAQFRTADGIRVPFSSHLAVATA